MTARATSNSPGTSAGPRQHEFSPQPYRQLADVLTAYGYERNAIGVRMASKTRELFETPDPGRKLNLALQWLFIGYGYGTGRVALWVLLLTVAGAAVIRQTPQGRRGLSRIVSSTALIASSR